MAARKPADGPETAVDAPDTPEAPAAPQSPASGAEKAPERTFRLRDAAAVDEHGVHRVCLGSNPRISLGPGDTFATSDERLGRRLAAVDELEEVSAR